MYRQKFQRRIGSGDSDSSHKNISHFSEESVQKKLGDPNNNLTSGSPRVHNSTRDFLAKNAESFAQVFLGEPFGSTNNLETQGFVEESTKFSDAYGSLWALGNSDEDQFSHESSFDPHVRSAKRSDEPPQLQEESAGPVRPVARPETGESNDGNGNVKRGFRRSSSLSSIPYFYPDPYSIVISQYLEHPTSSLATSQSFTSGSEVTEYLPFSSQPTPSSAGEACAESVDSFDLTKRASLPQSPFSEFVLKMNFDSALSTSEEYQSFRSSVPLRKYCVESDGSKEWKVYDAGPRSVRTPLLCLGPACATADVFYRQILNLTARGIRVIAVESPVYWSIEDWCKGLKKLLDCLNLDKVHIFGASLGGFLGQKFAEYTYHYPRVASLILCNTFLDTSIFDYHDSAMIFWMLPSVILKKLIIENITSARIMDLDIAHAIEFMIERLNNLSQQELASRLTLNCVNNHVDTFKLKQIKMTIMDVFDESALSNQAREDLYRNYTDAKLAHLKSGGNFPYLSRSEDVNMHVMVHLRSFNGTKHSALEESQNSVIGSAVQASSARPISTNSNGSNVKSSMAEDVLGSTEPQTLPVSSLVVENQAFKEKAASVLGLPTR